MGLAYTTAGLFCKDVIIISPLRYKIFDFLRIPELSTFKGVEDPKLSRQTMRATGHSVLPRRLQGASAIDLPDQNGVQAAPVSIGHQAVSELGETLLEPQMRGQCTPLRFVSRGNRHP